jgi:hypothetical protein
MQSRNVVVLESQDISSAPIQANIAHGPAGVSVLCDALLRPPEVAAMLGVKPHTLAVWRSTGRVGLPFAKIGKAVRYRYADVARFIETSAEESANRFLYAGAEQC